MSDSPSTITSSQQIIIKFETMNQTTPSPQQAKTSRLQKYYGIPVLATILFIFFFVLADHLFPLPIFNQDDYAAMIVAEDSTPLRAYAGQNGVWRYPLKSSEVSPLYLQALLNYEDRYYYYHFGVNPAAILRGLIQNIRAGHVVSGGSTLTMQVARIIDPRGHGYRAKLQQVFRALQLEYHCSKEEILTLYLNHAPYGGTVEGIGAASLTYFGKPPFELSHAEAALLAVLPQRPSALRPDRYPGRAERARDKVLDRMATFGIWSPAAVYQAKKEEVVAVHHVQPMLAPLLANRLRSETVAGTSLVTTINAQLQANLADCVANYAASVDDKVSAAVMVVENETMAVRAYVGSADFFSRERQGQVDMIRSVRSPGSTLKPFLYGMALDRGLIHSGSLLIDAPRFYSSYRPNNFGSGFSGPVSAAEALQRSLNLPAIQLIEQLGPASFTAGLAKGGVRLRLPSGGAPNPAIILGGAGTRLEDLVAAYTSLARKGRVGKLRYLRAQLSDPISDKYLLSEGAAWIIRTILAANPRPDRYRTSAVAETNPAWKTGTSYGFRDAWAMGVTPKYT
ncbi:MAG: penicillin-binding protein 1C, partial [Desulfobulbaceae bacterium]|nr:penicillin-binding protein 1C [Desulfobulbaceae bacterium]